MIMMMAAAVLASACGQKQEKLPALDLASLDTSVSPGQDFYQYATGGWQKAHPLPAEYSRYGSFDAIAETTQKQLNELFSSMARKVSRVVSRDESRPILTGVLVAFEDSKFKMVATDSYRLALAEAPIETAADDFSAVIAGSFINDLASLPKTGGDIVIAVDDSQIIASYNNIVFVNPRIEGKYPNYKQLLPSTCETRCIIDRAALLSGVKRASLLDHAASQVRFDVNAASQTIQLSAVTQDIGSIQEMMKAEVEGADIEIGFNSNFVMEGLSVMDSEQVSFEMVSATKPGVFKGYPDEGYLYLVMPVRI